MNLISFFTFALLLLLFLIKDVLLDLQFFVDQTFWTLRMVSVDQQFVKNEIGLDVVGFTLWKLKMRSN